MLIESHVHVPSEVLGNAGSSAPASMPLPGSNEESQEASLFGEPHGDEVTISAEALGLTSAEEQGSPDDSSESSEESSEESSGKSSEEDTTAGVKELTAEEEEEVRELQQRDREVRAHEQAHKAAAGSLAVGGPVYEYERGPDDRRYAVGGHVQIELREGQTAKETIALAQQARRAALAPEQPSVQDRAVAAEASRMEAEARSELRKEAEVQARDEEPRPDPLQEPDELARRSTAYDITGEKPATSLLGDLYG